MGLDVSHDCWHGAYSAFARWRNELARVAGYEMGEIEYDGGFKAEGPLVVLHERWTAENFQGDWPDGPPEDPLLLLIVHSDCDGHLAPEHAEFLAMRLEQLMEQPNFPQGDVLGHIENWQKRTQQFVHGLRRASDAGETVEFY